MDKVRKELLSYLNVQGEVLCGIPHAIDDHARDLARNDIVGNPVRDLVLVVGVVPARQEAEKVMVDAVQIRAVLPRVVEAAGGDLRELAAADPARRHEGIHGGDVSLPVAPGGVVAVERLAVEVQALVVAVPLVRLDGEGVVRVGRALVMAMDLQ